ncbi:hypothetical protein A2U01_0011299 [Trifolium medium]|uniref:Uncharacterized protein n=1 Tax=Trifolium medium TaxID=97028 RepID=A0A392MVR5_9FABA|nr:hypothetical protein [Trifolium medium]
MSYCLILAFGYFPGSLGPDGQVRLSLRRSFHTGMWKCSNRERKPIVSRLTARGAVGSNGAKRLEVKLVLKNTGSGTYTWRRCIGRGAQLNQEATIFSLETARCTEVYGALHRLKVFAENVLWCWCVAQEQVARRAVENSKESPLTASCALRRNIWRGARARVLLGFYGLVVLETEKAIPLPKIHVIIFILITFFVSPNPSITKLKF